MILRQYRPFLTTISLKTTLVAAVISALMPQLAAAADWKLAPSISLEESYTDNVTLSADNAAAESEWITQINPGVSLTGKGRELDLALSYRMQNLFYSKDSGRNNTNHQLDSRLNANLVPRWLFLDASAAISQQVVSPDDKVSTNNLAIIGNREDVTTASISPFINTRISKQILAHARFSHDRVMYDKNESSDSRTNQYELQLFSARTGSPWTWSYTLTSQDVEYVNEMPSLTQTNEKRRDAALDLGYQVSAKININGQLGYEANEYQLSADAGQPKDSHWRLNAVWTPNSRITLTAGAGERFFGRTWNLDFQQKGKRNTFHIGYDENLSSRRQLLQEKRTGVLVDDDGNIVQDPVPVLTNEVFIDRRATMQWSYKTRKTTTNINASRSDREYQLSNIDETAFTMSVVWDWQLTRKNDLTINVSHQNTKRDTEADTFNALSLGFNRQLGRQASSAVEVSHNRRVSDLVGNDYTENQLTARLDVRW